MSVLQACSSLLAGMQDLLLPARCLQCAGELEPWAAFLCDSCLEELLATGSSCCGTESLPGCARFAYADVGRQVLSQVKYGGQAALCRRLCRHWSRPAWPAEVLVPVPAHPVRKRERGGNPALLLARCLGREWRLPVAQVLQRRGDGCQQKSLDRAARLRNLVGQYRLRKPGKGQRVMLVDDVVTTGATFQYLAMLLTAGGWRVAGFAALAWTPDQGQFEFGLRQQDPRQQEGCELEKHVLS